MRTKATHYTRGGKRVRCGLVAKKTVKDTRDKRRVTCHNCIRGIEADGK